MRRGRRGKNNRSFDSLGGLGSSEPSQLEAAFEELVGSWGRQSGNLDVPALELREPAARSDLRLEKTDVALREDDAVLDILERRALGRDAKRNEVAAERGGRAAGDHEQRAKAQC